MSKKATKAKAEEEVTPAVAVKVYGAARQALEAHACPNPLCEAPKGEPCVGIPNAKFPEGYVWPKSKVHAARLALHNNS